MSIQSLWTRFPSLRAATALLLISSFVGTLSAQQTRVGGQSINFRVSGPTQDLEMVSGTSRILTLDNDVPRLLVNDPDIVRAIPLGANEIQLSARQPGVTDLNVWDDKGGVHTIHIRVHGDSREMQELLRRHFPSASVRIEETRGGGVMLSGYVAQAEDASGIVRLAESYYTTVNNRMRVGGAQQVQLHVKVVEVSRTKLRQLGVDWAVLTGSDFVIQSVSGLVAAAATQGGTLTGAGDTLRLGILSNGNSFGAYVDALRRNNLAKLLAEPTLVTRSGRPAQFQVGGQIPVPVPAGLGVTSIEYRDFGTQVDFVPILQGNGNMSLEIRGTVTEIDPSLNVNNTPGFRSRRIDTGIEIKAGQTLALAGLVFNRVDSENRGIPFLSDIPWFGVPFRRVEDTVNEVELLIMVTPELVDALDPHEVPACGPGQHSTQAGDVDFYFRGYPEVPRCCLDGSCAKCRSKAGFEELPQGQPGQATGGEIIVPRGGSLKIPPAAPVDEGATEIRLDDTGARLLPRIKKNQFAGKTKFPTTRRRRSSGTRFQNASSRSDGNLSNPYVRSNPTPKASDGDGGKNDPMPSLIGPIGYDVLK